MRNIFIKIFGLKRVNHKKENINISSVADFHTINKEFLQENISDHQIYSEKINNFLIWDNFYFNHALGYMEFSNDIEGFVLALTKECIIQAESLLKLSNNIMIFTKVLNNGTILVNINSSEFQQLFTCYSIKWFKKTRPR